jgi:uncharacterized protein (TIGR00369 family)
MEKIQNIWLDKKDEGYNCFGCAPHNPIGLHLEFFRDGDETVCFWNPSKNLSSWIDVVHGGVQCVALDEISAWTITDKLDTCGVTAKMEVKYLQPLLFSDGQIEVRAKLVSSGRITIVKSWIVNGKGEICTTAEMRFYIYPQQMAVEKFHYTPREKRKA